MKIELWMEKSEHFGGRLVDGFHMIGLFVIGAAILWASWAELIEIIAHGGPRIKDVLLLFIYLELGAMVGIYFKTKHMPVRFLIYIAITALTRVLAIDVKEMSDIHMLTITGAILILSLAVVALRFASHKYPTHEGKEA
jgi:phosphate starvation-inducible membrane PsiE